MHPTQTCTPIILEYDNVEYESINITNREMSILFGRVVVSRVARESLLGSNSSQKFLLISPI